MKRNSATICNGHCGRGACFSRRREGFTSRSRRIAQRLRELNVPYAVAGGMAMFFHGFRRFTEDVDILVTREGLERLHQKLEGLGYVPLFPGSKNLRDAESGVRIEFLVTGDYPGDGKPKPVAFPDPEQAGVERDGIRWLNLPALVELKLASGMTAPGRLKDLADVQELIRLLRLPADFAEQLQPFVGRNMANCGRYKAIRCRTRGAYGYSGKYIAQRLLDEGQTVVTLTNSLSRANPFGDRIKAFPFHFDQPDLLAEHLQGRVGPLQHLLGAIQPSPVQARRCRAQHAHPLRGGQEGGRPADRPRQHHQPFRGFAAGVFPGQGDPGKGPDRISASPMPSFGPPSSSGRRTS